MHTFGAKVRVEIAMNQSSRIKVTSLSTKLYQPRESDLRCVKNYVLEELSH